MAPQAHCWRTDHDAAARKVSRSGHRRLTAMEVGRRFSQPRRIRPKTQRDRPTRQRRHSRRATTRPRPQSPSKPPSSSKTPASSSPRSSSCSPTEIAHHKRKRPKQRRSGCLPRKLTLAGQQLPHRGLSRTMQCGLGRAWFAEVASGEAPTTDLSAQAGDDRPVPMAQPSITIEPTREMHSKWSSQVRTVVALRAAVAAIQMSLVGTGVPCLRSSATICA